MPTPATTAVWTSGFLKPIASLAALAAVACAPATDAPPRRAPAADDARAVSQLAVAGNACGPAALLNSLRFADEKWRTATTAIDGETDRGQLFTIIRRHGLRPSPHMGGRPRWTHRGVNVVDLTDIANEIATLRRLPEVKNEILVARQRESPIRQLTRTHRRLETSLARGLPPLLSIRRFARRGNASGTLEWVVIDAHFVTVTRVPRRLPRHAGAFSIGYIDPWGAHHREGVIRVSAGGGGGAMPFPEARFPGADVGIKRVRPGGKTLLVASAVIGRW